MGGTHTVGWQRRVTGLPAGKAETMNKISTHRINRISRRRGTALWEFQ